MHRRTGPTTGAGSIDTELAPRGKVVAKLIRINRRHTIRRHGITYDTGFDPSGELSRLSFDEADVVQDMAIIRHELHCDAIRVTGSILDRVEFAARAAADAGLDVWYSPFPCELEPAVLRNHLVEAARRAEQLRTAAPDVEVVFVAGCEISLFNRGLLPGNDLLSRLEALKALADSGDPADFGSLLSRLNQTLSETVAEVRAEFTGRISYASGAWEFIDWAAFDIIGIDAYRTAENAGSFAEDLRTLRGHGKPVAATEFGCCTFQGAADLGGEGWTVLDESGPSPRVRVGTVRDEDEQARYFTEVLETLEQEGIDSAFWFTYAGWELPHGPQDPDHDLDVASYGAQAVLEDRTLGAKMVFNAIATAYQARSRKLN